MMDKICLNLMEESNIIIRFEDHIPFLGNDVISIEVKLNILPKCGRNNNSYDLYLGLKNESWKFWIENNRLCIHTFFSTDTDLIYLPKDIICDILVNLKDGNQKKLSKTIDASSLFNIFQNKILISSIQKVSIEFDNFSENNIDNIEIDLNILQKCGKNNELGLINQPWSFWIKDNKLIVHTIYFRESDKIYLPKDIICNLTVEKKDGNVINLSKTIGSETLFKEFKKFFFIS